MLYSNNFYLQNISRHTVLQRMLLGALIGFCVIAFLVFSVDNPKPEWGSSWKIKPLLLTPLVTALGSLAFLLKDIFKQEADWKKALALSASIIGFILSVWIGVVLGLNGTLWN